MIIQYTFIRCLLDYDLLLGTRIMMLFLRVQLLWTSKGKMEQLLKSFDSSLSADEAKAAMTRNQAFIFLAARTGLNRRTEQD